MPIIADLQISFIFVKLSLKLVKDVLKTFILIFRVTNGFNLATIINATLENQYCSFQLMLI